MSVVAWLGGLAFAGSLLYLGYFYAVILSRPGAEGGAVLVDIVINTTNFSLFALHHSVFARTAVKARIGQLVDARVERSLYVWVASGLLVAVCLLWRSLPGIVYDVRGVARLVLYGVQTAGVLLTIKGAGVIDPLELAGIRQVRQTESTASVAPPPLQVRGPFRYVRHPIYLGWVVIVFGAPLMTANRLLFAIISSTYLILAIPLEERSLVAAHGDQYRAYQRTVRWRLVPGLW